MSAFTDLDMLSAELKEELVDRILPYWIEKTPDQTYGGFIGRIDGHDRVVPGAPKSVILNTRLLWTFSATARALNRPDLLEWAFRAKAYLDDRFWDPRHGGLHWMVDHTGAVFSSKKHVYAQAFGIYAYSEHARATGDASSLGKAVDLFHLLRTHSFSDAADGYYEAFDQAWSKLDDVRLGGGDAYEKRSTNTHLHLLEAYTNLYRVWPDAELRAHLVRLLDWFLGPIYDARNHHFIAFFDERWAPRSEAYSYGHDIETTWLLHDAALIVNDPGRLRRTAQVVREVSDKVLREGLDREHGGLCNFGKAGHVLDSDKHWWVQAEGIVGFVNMAQMTGDASYLRAACDVWAFTRKRIIDPVNGEWHFRTTRIGQPYTHEDKVGAWKCPYHTVRACLEVMDRAERMRDTVTLQTPVSDHAT
jgi:mannobiose 2-epimerase